MSFFDGAYTEYWRQRVDHAADGSVVPDASCAQAVVDRLGVSRLLRGGSVTALDVGASTGRMHEIVDRLSSRVIALDIDPVAVSASRTAGYDGSVAGSALRMPFRSESFDLLFCWAVCDALDLRQALTEFNRVLEPGGLCLITAKSANYRDDDRLAWEAELGAQLKGFPARYVRLDRFREGCHELGLDVGGLVRFELRGDFGDLRVLEDGASDMDVCCYEFAALLQKSGDCRAPTRLRLEMDSRTSLRFDEHAMRRDIAVRGKSSPSAQ